MLIWQSTLLLFPAFLLVFYSYHLRTRQLKAEKKHTQDLGDVHMRMVEALALTIEAKDQTTHDHLQRVKIFCVEIGKELKLSNLEMQALSVASLLHDIGKLAVPEYIISKPGKLSVEELIGYLEKRRAYIPDYEQRQRAGLWIASTRVEKYNDWAVSARCKHQGMSWSPPGVLALAALEAARRNGELDDWRRDRALPERMLPESALKAA